MKDTAISVTGSLGNFAHCVNRVHYQNRSFVLVKERQGALHESFLKLKSLHRQDLGGSIETSRTFACRARGRGIKI